MRGFTKIQGMLVENDALRISEKIREISPDLRLQYLEGNPKLGEPPFRVVGKQKDGQDYVVCEAWILDDRLIKQIHMIDTTKRDIQAYIDKHNAKIKADNKKKDDELNAELHEIAGSALRSPKLEYKATLPDGKKVKLGDRNYGDSID